MEMCCPKMCQMPQHVCCGMQVQMSGDYSSHMESKQQGNHSETYQGIFLLHGSSVNIVFSALMWCWNGMSTCWDHRVRAHWKVMVLKCTMGLCGIYWKLNICNISPFTHDITYSTNITGDAWPSSSNLKLWTLNLMAEFSFYFSTP